MWVCSVSVLTASPTFSQQIRMDVKYADTSLSAVIDDLSAQTGFHFVFFDDVRPENVKVNISVNNASLTEILDRMLPAHGLKYQMGESVVVIGLADKPATQQPQRISFSGTVRDTNGVPIHGATVYVKENQSIGTSTDAQGHFTLQIPGRVAVVVSFMGKKTREIFYDGQQNPVIVLEDDVTQIDNVIVTGIVDRKASSYTGNVSVFKNEDLQRVGSTNVLKSLELLEPTMFRVTDLVAGSNPNVMPTIELQGTSSFPSEITGGRYRGNPNQPLFILNGFESGLQTILDLDMNLIENVTILKDASAKAIYGSKASNGVIIVETKRPKEGKLQVSYSGSISIEAPDLSSYNLANSREKLEAELLAGGVYEGLGSSEDDMKKKDIYNQLYTDVLRGVDTYWLAEPVRTGVGNRHSLSIDGGDENYIYGANFTYNNIRGAMKNSHRNTLSGNVTLGYRNKNIAVQNNLFVTYNTQENPFHSFSDYAQQNPYWRKHNENGTPVKEFLSTASSPRYNPLWDDQWKAYNKANYTEITNNLQADWTIIPALRLVGRFNFTKHNEESDAFRSPKLTQFIKTDEDQKGTYDKGASKDFSLGGDLNLTYSHVVNKDHIFFYNAGASFQTSNYDSYAFTAYGFPDDADFLYFAKGYGSDDKPEADESKTREMSFLGIFNYSYADRYMVDASLRYTGSSQFGRDKRWGAFWSVGVGWNLHNEPFIRESAAAEVIKLFKLRGSIGYSGSQNFDAYQSLATYRYFESYYYGGRPASYLQAFPNSDLRWQAKFDQNIGFDMNLWDRLNISANYYVATTRNSISELTTAPSVGFTGYAENVGDIRNKGFDVNASLMVFNNPKDRSFLTLNLTLASNKNEILKISDALQKYNDQINEAATSGTYAERTRPQLRFIEGRSMTAIWAIRSAGIDPLTGRELYIKRNGEHTYIYNANEVDVVGDSRPKVHGTFGFNFEWKGFSVNMAMSYQLGGYMYNTTLVDKVENASIWNNVDKRYLYDRWKEPGDVSLFKDIADSDATRTTSRFVMKNNQLVFSTINVGYEFRDQPFVKRLGLSSIKLSAYVNDAATISSIKQERGTAYPFARNFNFSLSFRL